MSHPEQMGFVESVKRRFPDKFKNISVLEVGSWNVNGSVRKYFENCRYIGIDLAPGKDVDLVVAGNEYRSEERFDVSISCECFEHNKFWAETFVNMVNHCKPNGLVVMTCATTGRGVHGTSQHHPETSLSIGTFGDYYKNLTEEDFRKEIDIDRLFSSYEFTVQGFDLYFWGIVK